MLDPDHLIAPLRADVRRGAAELVSVAADVFTALAADAETLSAHELRRQTRALAERVMAAQPAMAPIATLARAAIRALDAAPAEAPPEELARRVQAAVDAVVVRSREAATRIGRHAAPLLTDCPRVLTVSASSTVREALLAARTAEVVCLEGRPNLEGRELARSLAAAGIRSTIAVDAALAALLPECAALVVGADGIGDRGALNKVGTHAAAVFARRLGVPAYLLADTTKLLPLEEPQPLDDDRPASEVWPEAPAGVRVWNRYFEITPLALFTLVITEEGAETPDGIEARRAAMSE